MTRSLLCAAVLAISLVIAQSASAATVYAVTSDNSLLRFSSSSPGVIESAATISGLEPGDQIVGIDIRPSNQGLYGFGSSGRIYAIDKSTAVATSISSAISPMSGGQFGVDWEPASDSLRVVSDLDENRRYSSDGASVFVGPLVSYAGSDQNAGVPPAVSGVAYAGTTLYDIDYGLDTLVTQDLDAGVLHTIGDLGVRVLSPVGFDVVGGTPDGAAFASLVPDVERADGPAQSVSHLYTLNLTSGNATLIGQIGSGHLVRGLTLESTTAVHIQRFVAATSRQGVVLRWRTLAETGVLGFRPYREAQGLRVPLVRTLIPAVNRNGIHSYRWVHRLPRRTAGARYWLEAVHADGSSTWLGPVAVS